MRKQEFLDALQRRLSGLPRADVDERLAFWSEMIDDRIEEGVGEEEAVRDIGSVEEIAAQIIRETSLARIAKERIKPKRRLRAWEIVLLVLGSPIWFSLAVAAFSVILSLYAVLWALIVSLWAVFVSLAACAIAGVFAGVLFAFRGYELAGIAMVGASVVCAGLAILLFFGSFAATKGSARLTKKIAFGIKKCFVKQEGRK